MKKKKEKKAKKSKKIIIVVILVMLAIAGAGFYFLNSGEPEVIKKSVSVKTKWGKTYYDYLKKVKESPEEAELDDIEEAKLYFIEAVDVTDPLMIISYKKNDKDNANLYYIDGKNVEVIKYESSEVKYIYTQASRTYEFFIKSVIGDTISIIPIREQIDYHRNLTNDNNDFASQIDAIKFTSQDRQLEKDEDGKDVILTNYESTFIELDTNNIKEDFDTAYSDGNLKKCINNAIKKYKTNDELQTDKVKKTVRDEKERIRILTNKLERLRNEKNKPKTDNTTKQNNEKNNTTSANNTNKNEIKSNPKDIYLTQENADNIIKRFYGLDDNFQIKKDGVDTRFASLGEVTYKGDNQKYYYYSSFNVFDSHTSYNGSVIVNAITGKIKSIGLISRDVPASKEVPATEDDKNLN